MEDNVRRLLILVFLLTAPLARGQTCTATSTSSSAVQAAITNCSSGGTVVLPSGTSSWSSDVTASPTGPLVIQGQTTCTGTPASSCTDNTNVTINNPGRLILNPSAAHFITVTGISFTIANADFNNGAISFFGTLGQVGFRFHHNHVVCTTAVSASGLLFINAGYGLFDHLVVTNSGTGNHTFAVQGDRGSAGNNAWALSLPALGTGNANYIEDSTFTLSNQTDGLMDGFSGGRMVFRYNNVTESASAGADNIGTHGTDSGSLRSFYSMDINNNTFTNNSGGTMTSFRSRGGTSLIWSNTWGGSGGYSGVTLQNFRADGGGNVSTWQNANGTNWQLQTFPCGQSFAFNCTNGIGGSIFWCNINRDTAATSNSTCSALTPGDVATAFFDSNPVGTGGAGYAPRDNIGRTHNQTLAPVYEWLNSPDPGIGSCCNSQVATYIVTNQDYYAYTGSFTGATGVGSGLLSARPVTCTPGPSNSSGVGYWATDVSTLYTCTGTNTWTVYYTPLPHPYPLSGPSTPPSAPTSLIGSVSGSVASLSWIASSGSPTPTAYTLYRGTIHNGPYAAVKSGITALSTTDSPANGTYFYVVTAYIGGIVSSITGSAGVATVTCAAACTFPSGTVVAIAGNSVAAFNGTFTVASQPTPTTFTYVSATTSTGTGGGTWQPSLESGRSNEVQLVVPAVASVGIAPASLAYASFTVGTSSPTQTVTVTNTSGAGTVVTFTSITFAGTNPGDFSRTTTCTTLSTPGQQCTVTVTFTPTAPGARSATLTFVDNAVGSPQTVAVSGTGVAQAPGVSLNPTSLTFGAQTVSTTSGTLSIILTNTGSGTLTVTSVVASGDFAVTTVPATNCGTTLASLATCSLNVTFTPIATGGRTGAVMVTDNATGSPHVATLAGTGITTKCAFAGTFTLSGHASVCQ